MKHSVIEMTRAVRRRLERVVRKSREQDYARRALAVLHLWETQGNVTEAAHRVRAARSSVYRWQSLYETYGEDGIRAQARGRSDWKANEEVLSMLESIVREAPRELGYLRSRWSSQLLAMELESRSGVEVHATTVRRKRCEWPTLTSVCRGVEVPGQKFPDSRLRVAAGGLLQRALEPGVGLDPIHLARLQKRRDLTPRGGASSWPANSAFFAVSFTGRIRFSTKFVSISTRPS